MKKIKGLIGTIICVLACVSLVITVNVVNLNKKTMEIKWEQKGNMEMMHEGDNGGNPPPKPNGEEGKLLPNGEEAPKEDGSVLNNDSLKNENIDSNKIIYIVLISMEIMILGLAALYLKSTSYGTKTIKEIWSIKSKKILSISEMVLVAGLSIVIGVLFINKVYNVEEVKLLLQRFLLYPRML